MTRLPAIGMVGARKNFEGRMYFIPLVRIPGLGSAFVCRSCSTSIASENDLIGVMGRPVQTTYENPLGVSCEIATFVEAKNLVAADFSTEEHTWFEGYTWRPVGCAKCRMHLGWRFEAAEPYLDPQNFFGLLVDALRKTSEESAGSEQGGTVC